MLNDRQRYGQKRRKVQGSGTIAVVSTVVPGTRITIYTYIATIIDNITKSKARPAACRDKAWYKRRRCIRTVLFMTVKGAQR
jgi:hypothetical protein